MIQWLFFNVFNALFHDIVYKIKVAGILPGELARCFGGLHFPTSRVDSLRLYVEHCQYCWLCRKRFWRLVNPYIFAFDESGESVLMSNSPPKQLHWLLRCKMFLLGWVDFGFPFLECQGGDQSKPFLAPSYFGLSLQKLAFVFWAVSTDLSTTDEWSENQGRQSILYRTAAHHWIWNCDSFSHRWGRHSKRQPLATESCH